ncbi:MAG: folate family ECF transporter S component [Oscillospiraceae bacterium]|nr:folate family ECF transporter S component [Oscillospiraceae bacterium]
MFKQKFTTRTLTTLAMLIAIEVILSRFLSINAWNIKIGFGFVPVLIAAILYGPLAGGLVGALSDFIGAVLFPIGTYFPGFTLTSFLMGLVFGLFLYKKQGWLQGFAAVGINQFILGLFLNTFWISLLYGSPYVPLLATRVFQSILLSVVQLICIQLMVPILNRYGKKVSVT